MKYALFLVVGLGIVHLAVMQMQKQLMVHLLGFVLLIALYWVKTTMKKMVVVLNVIMPVSHARIAKITIVLNVLTD